MSDNVVNHHADNPHLLFEELRRWQSIIGNIFSVQRSMMPVNKAGYIPAEINTVAAIR